MRWLIVLALVGVAHAGTVYKFENPQIFPSDRAQVIDVVNGYLVCFPESNQKAECYPVHDEMKLQCVVTQTLESAQCYLGEDI